MEWVNHLQCLPSRVFYRETQPKPTGFQKGGSIRSLAMESKNTALYILIFMLLDSIREDREYNCITASTNRI